MASGAQQLQNDFEQVKKLLTQYPDIRLLQTEGDPPESYDLEYNIKGYKSNPDGTASPDDVHQVRISLPFGYPHFAPTAKPLTPIFHPDIDPDAIRIADFWGSGKSLPELILHIGRMICGEIYGADEPFNQRAFDWYEERKSWMPFDILEPHEAEEESDAAIEFEVSETEDDLTDAGLLDDIELDNDTDEDGVDAFDEDFSFQLDDVDDLVDTDADTVPVDFAVEEKPAEATELGGLSDLPAEDSSGSDNLMSDTEEPRDSIELGDIESLDADSESGIFEGDLESLPEENDSIELDDLAGLEDDTSSESHDFEEEVKGLEALADEPAEEPEEEMVDFGGIAEEETPGQEEPVAEEEDSGLDEIGLQLDDSSTGGQGGEAQSIRTLIENKEIFTAKKVLDDLADPGSVPDLKELELTVSAAISEAEELYKKADKLEQKGELEKAGLVLDLVANVATDYPGLELARNRIRESKIADDQEKTEAIREEREKKQKSSRMGGLKIPYKSIAAIVIVATIGGAGFKIYMNDSENMLTAQSKFVSAEQQVQKKEFKQAKQLFDAAQAALGDILLLKGNAKEQLQQQIDAMTSTQAFKEGLQGRVLYEGQYVSVEAAKAIDEFKKHLRNADMIFQAGNSEQAIKAYEETIAYAEKAGFEDEAQSLRQKINNILFQQTLAQARQAEEEREWKQAADTYQKALKLSSNLVKPEDQKDITQRLAAAAFRHELDESKRAFTASEWEKTIEMLQRAQKILDENPTIASADEKKALSRLLVNSRLYRILSVAKKAFEKKMWDLAVKEYRSAIDLLAANSGVLGKVEVEESRKTIEKTILMTLVSREQHLITTASADNDLQSTLNHYQTIVDLIDKNTFRDDPSLRPILADARKRVVSIEEKLYINRRVDWLTTNYERIFRENYPSAKSSELLNPKVTFIKREGDIMVFRMSCVEKKQGRAFRLELNYQYNTDRDNWKLYSGKL